MTAGKIRMITTLILVGFVIIIGLSGIYVVKEGEQAVVLTFGRITDQKGAGFYWHLPMVQSIRTQSTEAIYTMEYGFRTTQNATTSGQAAYDDKENEAIMLTGDQNIIKVEVIYQVVVQDVSMFFYKVDDPFDTMQKAFETVLRRNIQNNTLDEALLNKETIEEQLLEDFREMLMPYELGVTITHVKFQNIEVPVEVDAAYQDVINAKNEYTRRQDEAEKYKNEVVPKARAESYKLIQDAEAYRAIIIASAEGEVVEFNEVYAKYVNSKEITRTRLLIETLENILSNANQIYMMDDDSGALKLLTLNQSPAPAATPQPQTIAPEGGN